VIDNATVQYLERILVITYPLTRSVELYAVEQNKPTLATRIDTSESVLARAIAFRFPAMQLQLAPQQQQEYLIKIEFMGKANHALELRPQLYSVSAFIHKQLVFHLVFASFIGFCFALAVYNGALYFKARMSEYGYYSLYISCYIFIALSYEGLAFYLPRPPPIEWLIAGITLLPSIAGLYLIAFGRSILRIAQTNPRLDHFYQYSSWALWAILPLSFFYFERLNLTIELTVASLAFSIGIVAAWQHQRGNDVAKYFALSFVFLALAYSLETLLYSISSASWLPANIEIETLEWIEQYLFYSCAAIEMIFLSLALSSHVEQLRDEKNQAQQATINEKNKRNLVEQENADKSRFLAAASHDLRQPLHTMDLFINAIKSTEDLQKRQHLYELLEKTLASTTKLFDELLDISKLDSATTEIKIQPINIDTLMANAVHEFELEAQQKGLKLRYRISHLTVNSDPLWLERILRNLISNAIRYTDNGGILLSCRRRSGVATLQIWDSGQGIAEQQQAIIFQEFTQLESTDGKNKEGLGLGLAIVHRLANLLDHRVTVQSKLHFGSVFSVALPLSSTNQITTPRILDNDNLRSKLILIIDANETNRIEIATMLEKWGCQLCLVESLEQATTLNTEQHVAMPAAIICDRNQFNTDSDLITLIQRFNSSFVDVPLLFIHQSNDEPTVTGMDAPYRLLRQPVKPAKLRIMLNSLLANRND
jgi:signal transduction histidine kinase/CheY-like chemotaxis protein